MAVSQQQPPSSHEHESSAEHAFWEVEAAEFTHIDEKCDLSFTPTSRERLLKATHDHSKSADDPDAPETVLYLAYGSNMCAQTFLGMRKVRPLSEMNVSAPSLNLTFDLPGVTYMEPCFANVEYRDQPEKETKSASVEKGQWDGSLMGVVYEVTKADWRNIMRTEGGGSSYNEIQVPCVPLPRTTAKSSPNGGAAGANAKALPETFFARTLYAPRLPKSVDPSRRSLWERLTTGPYRPHGNIAQASLRYLNLLRVGAEEHDLPQAYRDYLDNLQPYTATSWRQQVGKVILMTAFAPPLLLMMRISSMLADKDGRSPKPLATAMTIIFNAVWLTYDYVMKPIFGDGEKTVGKEKNNASSAAENAALLSEDSQ